MESLGENKSLTGGDQKIEEYVSRIKNGESKDSIFQGLPESFKSGIEKRLAEPTEEKAEQGINEIPPQYRGLDSETLDFIWTFPEYVDPEKTRELKEKKARALTALREKEAAEMAKTQRHEADQKKIEELRKQLGITEPLENTEIQESNSLQKKEVEYDDDEHRRAVGIYNTMVDIAAGMSEGLKEDIERKIQKYVDEIKSGKDEEYVLQGLPDKWKNAIRERLESKNTKLDKDITVALNETELGFNGPIIIEGNHVGDFSVWRINDEQVYLHDIQIGYDENAPRNKGYGFEAYKKIIEELRKKNIKLASTDWAVSQTGISPQALRVWEKLEAAGYVKKIGETEGKIYDRFTGEEKIQMIPKYESIV